MELKKNQLSNELRQLRGNLKKTIFAKMLGVDYQTYLRYESGKREPKEPVMKLARILGNKVRRYPPPEDNMEIPPIHDRGDPGEEHVSLCDPAFQVIQGVKEIFKSNNPVLIQALVLNVAAFQMAAKMGTDQKKEIEKLHNVCKEVLERVSSLEEKKSITGPGPAGDRMKSRAT